MTEPTRLTIILGSAREGRYCDTVFRWVLAEIGSSTDFVVDVIDPASLDLGSLGRGNGGESVAALRQRIDEADAFLVVTPEYNHGYPAALKAVIDSAYIEWQAKPVAFISYGGISGGLRAVEQLRLVFAELHAVTLRDSVSFPIPWRRFGANGLADAHEERKALDMLLARLLWWSHTLRRARLAAPYAEVAA